MTKVTSESECGTSVLVVGEAERGVIYDKERREGRRENLTNGERRGRSEGARVQQGRKQTRSWRTGGCENVVWKRKSNGARDEKIRERKCC